MYKHLENKMCKELEALEEKYRTGMEMSEGDLRRIDLLVHSLKSLATYKAMREAEEMQNSNSYMSSRMNSGNSYMNNSYTNNSYANNSYARGRDGRFISQDMSGHYPMNYPPYPEEQRW